MFKETLGKFLPFTDTTRPSVSDTQIKPKDAKTKFAEWYELNKRIIMTQARDRAVSQTVQTPNTKTYNQNHELKQKETLEQVRARVEKTPFDVAEQGLMMATWILPEFDIDPYLAVLKDLRSMLDKNLSLLDSSPNEVMGRVNVLTELYYIEEMIAAFVQEGEANIEAAAKERFAPVVTLAEDLTKKYLDRFFASRGYGAEERRRLVDKRFDIGYKHQFDFSLINVPNRMGSSDDVKSQNTIYLRSVSDEPNSDMVLDEPKLLAVLVHEQLHSRSARETDVGVRKQIGLDAPEMFDYNTGAAPEYERPERYLNEIATEYTARHIIRQYHSNKAEEDVWVGATAESMKLGYQSTMQEFGKLLDNYPNDADKLLDLMSVGMLEEGKWRELKQYLGQHKDIYRDLKRICTLEFMPNIKRK